MIVVDTNIVSYLLIPGPFSDVARRAAAKDSQWCAPLLWRSELSNILALYLRRNAMTLDDARFKFRAAERLLWGREHTVRFSVVLDCVMQSNRSAYDCEFVALALDLGLKLITADEPIVREFPSVAIHVRDFVAE